jgi:hypothetical protein
MQASKIQVGKTYAIEREGKLIRFNVESVTTTRFRNTGSPHDYTSRVQGSILAADAGDSNEAISVKPEAIKGPFEDYVELVARQTAEHEQRNAKAKAKTDAAEALRLEFYGMAGITPPEGLEPGKYGQPIRAESHGGVYLDPDAVLALLHSLDPTRAVRELAGV